ncbi:hypothetical protein JTE90_001601 [Oedothorax gibbosus]|uniref:Dynein light chain n=1 Tax=Oedothorax gibbosus TaxID=931172 RepID=A0AAV6VNF6_9ARAC|nr:hypothetical protein JTE90_001601 [Oedothorax gibbosus]
MDVNNEIEKTLYEGYAKQAIRDVIGEETFRCEMLEKWTTAVIYKILERLEMTTNKYIVTCNILQKTGAGYNTASSCRWDNTTDVCCCVQWENDSLICVVCIFGMNMIYESST